MPKARRWRLPRARLDELVDEATVDAYNEAEQKTGLLTAIQEHVAVPFQTTVLGVEVVVEKIDFDDADEIVAICRRGRDRLAVPILDLPVSSKAPEGFDWIEAYRWWAKGGGN